MRVDWCVFRITWSTWSAVINLTSRTGSRILTHSHQLLRCKGERFLAFFFAFVPAKCIVCCPAAAECRYTTLSPAEAQLSGASAGHRGKAASERGRIATRRAERNWGERAGRASPVPSALFFSSHGVPVLVAARVS